MARRLIHAGERVVGRRNVARAARLLTNEVRRDTPNDISVNGETLVHRAVAAAASPADIVFDVGAHFGEWSTALIDAGYGGRVVAFEPSASTYRHLTDSVTRYTQVECHQVALSDHEGRAELGIVHDGAGSNSVVPFGDGRTLQDSESITLTTVDAFCAEHQISGLSLLKIDAEGHDLAVIRGAAQLLGRCAIDMVQFEYNWRWIDARVFLADAFDVFMPLGYRLGKITADGVEWYARWHQELETFREGNYLACVSDPVAGRIPRLSWWNESALG